MTKLSGKNKTSFYGKVCCVVAGIVLAQGRGTNIALMLASGGLFCVGMFIWMKGEWARRGSSNEEGNPGFSVTDAHASEPLTTYLDAIGFPRHLSRRELQDRFGIKPHPAYDWDIVQVPSTPPFVKGLLWPLSYNVNTAHPDLPVVEFSGHSYYCNNPRKNLRLTVRELTPILGAGTPEGTGHRWTLGAASVQLLVWENSSSEGQQPGNPAHEREARLRTACHITVNVGYRPPISAADKTLLESFVPIAPILQPGISLMPAWFRPAPERILEFIRLPGQESVALRGYIGCSADRTALIFFNDELVIIPMDSILEYFVERVLPAKGHGGAWLSVECKCDYDDTQTKSVPVCTAYGADDLNELAILLSNATGKPHVLGNYSYNC